jgi:hypothetical protein
MSTPMDRLLETLRAMRRDLGVEASHHVLHSQVSYDDEGVCLHGKDADGRFALQARFAWTAISRVCFKDNGPMASDVVYVITTDNERTLAIPLETLGGGEFWRQLRVRGIFPTELHERATLSMDGRLYCWPPLAEGDPQDA